MNMRNSIIKLTITKQYVKNLPSQTNTRYAAKFPMR